MPKAIPKTQPGCSVSNKPDDQEMFMRSIESRNKKVKHHLQYGCLQVTWG